MEDSGMKSSRMRTISRITRIVSKILEVTHWVGTVLMAAIAVCAAAAPQGLKYLMDVEGLRAEQEVAAYGFEINMRGAAGEINMTTLCLFAVAGVLIFSLMAMVFRNLYLIIKKSEGASPFQKDNIRMLREIGIFSVAVPVIELVMSGIIRLAVGVEGLETSVSMNGIFMALLVLCLTEFFAYGAQLEKDMDGLL